MDPSKHKNGILKENQKFPMGNGLLDINIEFLGEKIKLFSYQKSIVASLDLNPIFK